MLVHRFLYNVKITGRYCEVDDTHRILVAASAVIPVFSFRNWEYTFLEEVVLYPTAFEFPGPGPFRGKKMHGVVGNKGILPGKMLLSMEALHDGFRNPTDMRNVAIHEFMHLIDKSDGKIDGIPELLLKRQFTLPWIHLIMIKTKEISMRNSDIREYGKQNSAEFLAVVSEYFFESPHQLAEKHPRLYDMLSEMFCQDPAGKKPFLRGKNRK